MTQLYQQAVADVAADGSITITFPSPGAGYWWTGTVSVTNAQGGEEWTAEVSGQVWGQFLGANPFGPIQLGGGTQLQVVATGLTEGTQYVALITGSIDADGNQPDAAVTPVTSETVISGPVTAVITGPVTIEGNVTAEIPDQALGNSPWQVPTNATGLLQKTFTIPAGAVFNSIILGLAFSASITYDTYGTIQATGANSGITWLQPFAWSQTIEDNSGSFSFPFSSVIDPDGIVIDVIVSAASAGSQYIEIWAVGSSAPLEQRIIAGPRNFNGPTLFAVSSCANSGGTNPLITVSVGRATVRLFSAYVQVSTTDSSAGGDGLIEYDTAGNILLQAHLSGANQAVTVSQSFGDSGLPLTLDNGGLNVVTNANGIEAVAGVFYSIDA